MTNLDIIKAAEMGYSAVITYGVYSMPFKVVEVVPRGFVLSSGNIINEDTANGATIRSFLYIGHLFGEPVIPEGQKFRFINENGDVGTFFKSNHKGIKLSFANVISRYFHPSELEPVFTH